jgi:hypothetical protein
MCIQIRGAGVVSVSCADADSVADLVEPLLALLASAVLDAEGRGHTFLSDAYVVQRGGDAITEAGSWCTLRVHRQPTDAHATAAPVARAVMHVIGVSA